MLIKDFVDEYGRYRVIGDKAMAQVSDADLNHIPVGDGNSIAMIVRHVGGNLVSRFTDFLTADGEKPWRNRDGEFADGPFTRADVQSTWAKGFDTVAAQLAKVSEDDLGTTITIRGAELRVHEALCRSLAHTAMHTGQIILLAKIAAGSGWQTLSIPKGKSAEYAPKPGMEKAAAHAASLSRKK
ncbi:MAG TPA: DUF1572 family protein [Gemmatimonadaceae bacterium]|nr:DUF1572 family protein [Gemmatimonadaceae bacterium]